MTIANQRIILNLVKEGSITGITPLQLEFEYGNKADLEREANMLQKAGYWVISKDNMMTVAS